MFSYNDGRLHEQVEAVIGGKHRIPFKRLGSTTQFIAPNRETLRYKHESLSYELFVDGQRIDSATRSSMSAMTGSVQKDFWQGTPYIHIRAKSSSTENAPVSKLIYVIPGNPGLCEFYAEFIESLSQLVSDAEIVAVSYLGYNVDDPKANGDVHLLDEQLRHKVDFFDFYLAKIRSTLPENAPLSISVLGHSVGAWMAQRVATQRRRDVDFVGLLTPTVKDISLSERGRAFTELTKFFGMRTVWAIVYALKWVPFYQLMITRLLARIMPVTEVNGMARDASLGIALSPQICRQIVGMAIEEMERIGSEIEPQDIDGFWEDTPIWACFAEHDHWVSDDTRTAILEYTRPLANVRSEIVPVPHAFVLRESDTVAALSARQINKL